MKWDLNSLELSELQESKRAKLFSDALESLEEWKNLVINKFTDVGDWEDNEPHFSIKNNYEGDREIYNSYERMSIRGILTQKGIESISQSNLESLSPHVQKLIKNKSDETKLFNDLAFFFLNNTDEFIKFCNETLRNNLNKEDYSTNFITQLNDFYHRSYNFTNTFLSFYMTYISKINYISETSKLTENFNGSTNLLSIMQSNHFAIGSGGWLKQLNDSTHNVFSVDLKSSIDKVLEYMYIRNNNENPFRVRIGGMYYYRDLANKFTTYAHFEEIIRGQFTENILNKTGGLYIGDYKDKAYFAYKGELDSISSDTLEFKVYGVDFKQTIVSEEVGGK